jgi:hypothetical protein
VCWGFLTATSACTSSDLVTRQTGRYGRSSDRTVVPSRRLLEPLVRTPGTAACSTPSHLLPNRHNGWALRYSRYLYLLRVSTRRTEKLAEQLGINRLSKSQVSVMAKDLNAQVKAFRTRPLDAGPYTFLAADTLTMKVRRGRSGGQRRLPGRERGQRHGHREILGVEVCSAESEAGWLQFFRGLSAPGLSGCLWSAPTPRPV